MKKIAAPPHSLDSNGLKDYTVAPILIIFYTKQNFI